MKITFASAALMLAVLTAQPLHAIDFADRADVITQQIYNKPLEIEGVIHDVTTKKPGWFGVMIDHGNGKGTRVIVSPATKFWENYKPLDAARAQSKIAAGQKIRMIHKLEMDMALHLIWASDVMFVGK